MPVPAALRAEALPPPLPLLGNTAGCAIFLALISAAAAAAAVDSGGWCIVGYRGAEEAGAISFCTVIFVFKTPGRKMGPDAPPGAIPPSPPSPQQKAPAAPAFEGEIREGRMNEGE